MATKKFSPENIEDESIAEIQLENEVKPRRTIIKVRPLPPDQGEIIGFGYEKLGSKMAPGTVLRTRALFNRATGKRDTGLEISVANPWYDKVKDPRETILYREVMEKKLGGRYNLAPESDFWEGFVVRLENKTNIFNMDIPEDELRVAVLKAGTEVLPSIVERTNRRYIGAKFVFDDPEVEAESKLYKQEVKRKAFKKFDEMNSSMKGKMARILQIMETANISDKVIDMRLFDFIEANPKVFLDAANRDLDLINAESLLYEALEYNVLRRKDGRVVKVSGDKDGAIIGNDIPSAVNFLMLKSNTDIATMITNEIQAKKNR